MRELKVFVLAAFFISILTPELIYSQEKTSEYNPLADNHWAVIFEAGVFMNGGWSYYYIPFTLSGKYSFSKKDALRLSLSTSGSSEKSNTNDFYFPVYNNENYDEDMFLGTELHWIHYIKPDSKIKFYTGIGPAFKFTHTHAHAYNFLNDLTFNGTENGYYFGLSGVLGVEYFILDNISLLGEYYASGYYEHSKENMYSYGTNYNNPYNYEKTNNGWFYDISRMRLGFSVYF